ncbi:NADH-ubiquinone oxidoreductase-F iron-sulfur binding region domain-containing protein [Nocardioides sp. GXZ039]|uniref:NADH-ubiquinone oxidoreductase-F iron-sulfur binding region domain-containing protein n=1 Tax=Nocardioides sp. GXZ039 TaxID=3136018 RepID=UPI0030F48FCB
MSTTMPQRPVIGGGLRVVGSVHDRLLAHDGSPVLGRPGLDELSELLAAAALTGRGGAGFPTGRKLATVAAQPRRPAVVVNAVEGEPLSRKDETLIALAPGLVRDGAEILAGALGAGRVVVAVSDRMESAALRRSIAAVGSRAQVRTVAGTFVGGQETAVVNVLNGRPQVPSDPVPPTWERGLERRPTLVVNTETAAQIALLVRHGAAWFRSVGTAEDPGTFLATVSGSSTEVVADGVTETPRGAPMHQVLGLFGLRTDLVSGVLVGGYHGAWLPASALNTPLDVAALAPWGAAPGAGVLHVLDRRQCPIEATASIAGYLAGQSARQCGPCLNGLPVLAHTLALLAGLPGDARRSPTRGSHDLVARVEHLTRLVEYRGACAHPDGTVRMVRSMLRTFGAHLEGHLAGTCPR